MEWLAQEAPTGTEHAAAGGESANVDATATATREKELADLSLITLSQTSTA